MKKEFCLLIALLLWAEGCAPKQTPSPSATPAPAQLPSAVNRVVIQPSAAALDVGDTVTVSAAILGDFGNPMYYFEITDRGDPAPGWFISILPGNVIHETTGSSVVLGLVGTSVAPDRISITFRAAAPGAALVRIGVNGEVTEADGTGRSFFNYETIFSESVLITAAGASPR